MSRRMDRLRSPPAALPSASQPIQEYGDRSAGEGFFVPPYLGSRGWIGIYLATRRVDRWELAGLVAETSRLVAPRRLAGQVGT